MYVLDEQELRDVEGGIVGPGGCTRPIPGYPIPNYPFPGNKLPY